MIKVQKLHPEAQLPVRNFSLDAGADLTSVETVLIPPGSYAFVDTGIAIQATDKDDVILWRKDLKSDSDIENPEYEVRSYFRIAPRSGLAFKNGIGVLAGVVDLGYTGSIKVGLINHSTEPFQVIPGMKIAQLIREVCIMESFVEVASLQDTDRAESGWGSTGV